ncbi:MAG: histidinol phosphate phosphatase [Planctomycetes bacterium]|nr:histidinol phosphate phosphatase [Planctomycetota bacterium]
MDERQLRDILNFAIDAAQAAGEFTLEHFNVDTSVEMKADDTPVTIADRGAEERLRERIDRAFPGHGIVGEEFGEKPGREPARWILDPIDGTYSFISGVPLYAVLVGFEWKGEVLAGVIHLPALRETVYAAKGQGCWWKRDAAGRSDASATAVRARVSDVADMSRARLVYGDSKNMYKHGHGTRFERLRNACYADRGWCDAYGYALVATGRAEITLDPIVSIWDTAALLPVVREAGGTLTDYQGHTTHRAAEIVATNGRLFEQVMAILGD